MRVPLHSRPRTASEFSLIQPPIYAPGFTPATPLDKRDWIAGLEKGLSIIEVFDDAHPRLTAARLVSAAA
jgi:hypothetical protein